MTYRMMTKMARLSVLTLCMIGLNFASVGCEEHKHDYNQTKQCCGKGGKCCKAAKKCGKDCKKACCKSAKACPAGCTKPCCK